MLGLRLRLGELGVLLLLLLLFLLVDTDNLSPPLLLLLANWTLALIIRRIPPGSGAFPDFP